MRYIIGCDVSKKTINMSVINENGVEQSFTKIPNTVLVLAQYFSGIMDRYAPTQVSCVVESTACYHHAVQTASYGCGMSCFVFNPIITKQHITASIRGKKTDRSDALVIARIGLQGEGRRYKPERYQQTKYYTRGQQRINEFKRATRAYAAHLQDLMEDSLAPEITHQFEQLHASFQQLKVVLESNALKETPPTLAALLQTIPGVGPYVASSLIGEIQSIDRFTSSKALVAYAGLDPKIRQSGHTLNNTGRLTKRGSTYLRRSIFIAASVARQHDPMLKALYGKKRAEGKPYTVAVCVVARKLLAIVRAVWLRNTPYQVIFEEDQKNT